MVVSLSQVRFEASSEVWCCWVELLFPEPARLGLFPALAMLGLFPALVVLESSPESMMSALSAEMSDSV